MWLSGLQSLEMLIQGFPRRIQNGAVLLAMSSQDLYPNMEVLLRETASVHHHDKLSSCTGRGDHIYLRFVFKSARCVLVFATFPDPLPFPARNDRVTARIRHEQEKKDGRVCIAVLGIITGIWKKWCYWICGLAELARANLSF